MSASTEFFHGEFENLAIGSSERVSEKIKEQLSVAVRSVQWSYGIFWSPSTAQEGKLVWRHGYYNGEIKTRKNFPPAEVLADKLGFGRSDLLTKLYERIQNQPEPSGSKGKASKADVLSEDELSDLEKYYLLCMFYKFEVGKCSHGEALEADHKPVWHWIVQDAGSKSNQKKEEKDAGSKVFSTSSEAKKASVKTVICFPHEGGVLELGVTDLVEENSDSNFIQHIKSCLDLVDSKDDGKEASRYRPQADNKASDSDEKGKVEEIMKDTEVTFPSGKKFTIEVRFPPTVLLTKFRKEVLEVKGLAKPAVNKCNDKDVPGFLVATVEAAEFDGSISELEGSIREAVRQAALKSDPCTDS